MSLQVEALRLELIKLTYTHSRLTAEAVDRARELEKYVRESDGSRETLHLKKPTTASATG